MSAFVDKDAVEAAARGHWAAILTRHYGVSAASLTGQHAPCPGCGGRDRFRFDDRNGAGSWLCSQGGGGTISGDGLALIMHVTGNGWHESLVDLAEKLGVEVRKGREDGGAGSAAPRTPEVAAPKMDGPGPGKARTYEIEALRRVVRPEFREMTEERFRRWSPIPPTAVSPGMFLETIYERGERLLAFTDFRSQGDWLYEVGRGWFRLGDRPGVRAVPAPEGPRGGEDGVWFLVQPVSGAWLPNPRQGGRLSRRSAEAVTRWSYLVLESDDAPEELWLGMLAGLNLPIQAVYRSGGRSIHALLKLPCSAQADWEYARRVLMPVMSAIGADPGAITAVRLSRLPGCWRGKSEQRLIYLHPAPDMDGIAIADGGHRLGVETT